jgi:2-furoate---CoA ligase
VTPLGRVLRAAVERDPGALAIVDGPTRLSYAAWNARVNRAARALAGLGVRRGDRVAVLLRNREETATVWAALQKLGAVYAPMNFRLAPAEVASCVALVRPSLLVVEDRTGAAAEAARARLGADVRVVRVGDGPAPAGTFDFEALLAGAAEAEAEPETPVAPDDLSLIFFTSGTTGAPKGVPRTHAAEYAAALSNLVHHRWRPGERTLGAMPLYHTMGVRGLLCMVCLNGAFVILRDWSAEGALAAIERERVSSLFLVPTMYHMLLGAPDFARRDLASVEHVAYAGMTMHDALNREIVRRLRPQRFVNYYGSSEIYSFACCDDVAAKPNCVGKPTVHSRLRVVVADRGRRVMPDETVPPGALGEIVASMDAPDAFSGYWENPDATARQVRDGWYYTGDLGYRDADGDYYVVGRVDDMIISGGENIHPLEVENVLARCPGVREVAVAGVPDDTWGEVVTAFVIPERPDVRIEDLDRHCRESAELAAFKRPRRIVLVAAIPKSPVGKVLRRHLRAGAYESIAGTGAPAG